MKLKSCTAIASAVLSMCVMFTACGKTTINVNDYLTIDVDGFDTAGTASYSFDSEALINDNLKAFGLDDSSEAAYIEALVRLETGIYGKLDKNSKLSNGDKVTFSWNEKGIEDFEEKYKVDLQLNDKSFVIEGLEEAESFDPFEYLTVSFDGIAPKGNATIKCSSDCPVTLDFKADKSDSLSNGDIIKVTANAYMGKDLKEYCFEKGYIPTASEKEFVVNGLAGYVQEIADIPEDAYNKMDSHAQDKLKAYVAANWVEPLEYVTNIELLGNYLLTPKDPSIYVNKNNYYYYVYRIDLADGLYYYYYTYYTDIMLLEDGTCSFDLGTATVPKGSVFFGIESGEVYWATDSIYFVGYGDIDSLFNKHITSMIGEYRYESTVK